MNGRDVLLAIVVTYFGLCAIGAVAFTLACLRQDRQIKRYRKFLEGSGLDD